MTTVRLVVDWRIVVGMQQMVHRLVPMLDWRHNGLGLLQGYVVEGGLEETRVHIWHPALEREGIEHSGKLHDHRFTLNSTVLVGQIVHTEYQLSEPPQGAYQTFAVKNARAAMADSGTFDGAVARGSAARYNARLVEHAFGVGSFYSFQRGAFHGTRVSDLCVTLVTKTGQREAPARILAPTDSKPVHAFASPLPREQWDWALQSAREALASAWSVP